MTRSALPLSYPHTNQRGSILPMVIIFSIVIAVIGSLALETITQTIAAQRQQYYTAIADEAAKAGITHANACIEATNTAPTAVTTLKPGTDCTGAPIAGSPDTVLSEDNWRSTYAVTISGDTLVSNGQMTFYKGDGTIASVAATKALKTNVAPSADFTTVTAPAANIRFTAISAGERHTCAISSGRAYCWGDNSVGQLGINDTSGGTKNTPQLIEGALAGRTVTDIKAGAFHTCAIAEKNPKDIASNDVFCWGRNTDNSLGDATSALTPHYAPTLVSGAGSVLNGKRAVKLAVGSGAQGNNGCVLTNEAAVSNNNALENVYCWGRNANGQLGTANTTTQTRPAQGRISATGDNYGASAQPFVEISMGETHTCGITSGGEAYCWGQNRPSGAATGTGAHGVDMTDYEYYGEYGPIYYGTGTDAVNTTSPNLHIANYTTPKRLGGDEATRIAAGYINGCTVAGGRVYCWGYNNQGQLGRGGTNTSNTAAPVPVAQSLSSEQNVAALDIDTKNGTSCAIYTGGTLRCWGANTVGGVTSIGRWGTNETTAQSGTPRSVPIPGNLQITQVSVGHSHTCAIAGNEGAAFCWGKNDYGQLGNGSTGGGTSTPGAVADTNGFSTDSKLIATAVSAGDNHTCAIIAMQVYCWGRNDYGQLGIADKSAVRKLPARVDALSHIKFIQITSGSNYSCAVSINNQIYCWGANARKQLGREDTNAYDPALVEGMPSGVIGIRTISAGLAHTCAVFVRAADEPAFCWGDNSAGQLGIMSTTPTSKAAPTIVKDSATSDSFAIGAVAAGSTQSCLTATNWPWDRSNTYCWGKNGPNGLLSSGGKPNADAIVDTFRVVNGFYNIGGTATTVNVGVLNGSRVNSFAAGKNFMCAVVADTSSNACWGRNANRQLADNTTTLRSASINSTYAALSGKRVIKTSVGDDHACSVLINNQLACWGMGQDGRIGSGNTNDQDPVIVGNLLAGKSVTDVAAGGAHTCAIADGLIYCWGKNSFGQLGTNSIDPSAPLPTQVPEYIIGDGASASPSNITY